MSNLTVKLDMYGRARTAPVRLEVLDQRLRKVASQWTDGVQDGAFTLDPGTYALRAALPSGRTFEQVVQLEEGKSEFLTIPVHEASPHEGHEWAYVSRDITQAGEGLLSEETFAGLWARLWSRDPDGPWQVEPLENPGELSDDEDGVSFSLHTGRNQQMMLQIGGDHIPWKLAVLPPDKSTMILIRPATGPAGRVHPVELVVSSEDWQLESLLSMLTRGKTDEAQDLVDNKDVARNAERRLMGKMADPYGALIGGYALLHLGALERMHDWAGNLARWFEWIPDGPVIHGWQQLEVARDEEDDVRRQTLIDEARMSFLEAERRGVPIIAEGVRRLRDGLLMFRSSDRGDKEVKDALTSIGRYSNTVDFTGSTTMFTGARPDEPMTEPPTGTPDDEQLISYVYDVPLVEALESGELAPGTAMSMEGEGTHSEGTVTAEGKIDVGGEIYDSFGAAQKAVTGNSRRAMYNWQTKSNARAMSDIARSIRFQPRKAYGRK